MKVTGFRLQQAIREIKAEIEVVFSQLQDSMTKFPDEEKEHPRALFQRYQDLETKMSLVQTAQGRFNLAVTVRVNGEPAALAQVIKLVGGAGRAEKIWREFSKIKKERYSYREDSRATDHVYAVRVMSFEECLAEAKKAAKWAAALREAIQVGNATEMEIDLDPKLLE